MKRYWGLYVSGVMLYLIASIMSIHHKISGMKEAIFFIITYALCGIPVFLRLFRNIQNKQWFNENSLVILASAGALGIGKYIEGTCIILLFAIVEIAERLTEAHSKNIIKEFVEIQPEKATRLEDGKEVQVEPEELKKDDIVVVKPGEKVPVDGCLVSGETTLNMQALTGEAMPHSIRVGEQIYAGCINLTGAIEVRVLKEYKNSTVARIMRHVEEAGKIDGEAETNMRSFMARYTLLVLGCALMIAVIPPTTFAWNCWSEWIYKALIFLVAACPCGLLASESLTFLGGIAAAAKHGILIKGAQYLEQLTKANLFIFDKTGTLTEGVFELTEIHPIGTSEEELLRIAAHVEAYSNHPLAKSLLDAYGKDLEKDLVQSVTETPGYGVEAIVDDKRVAIGNWRMVTKQNMEYPAVDSAGTVLYVIIDDWYAGYLVVEDRIREDSYHLMKWFKKHISGVYVMLTGDRKATAKKVAYELELDYAYAALLPEQKLTRLKEFKELQDDNERIVYVGDGINDAMVLAEADVGIAMGALGSDAAIEAADIVLMENDITKIIDVIKLSKEAVRVVKENIFIAGFVKFFVLLMAAFGLVDMEKVLIADLVILFIALFNAISIAYYPVE